ncbi:MAG TPA: sodium:solute symporter family protein [Lacipirellulaceae bacterium]|nr:sodium:solute symporter family protein [Lacipirellulaceae bacterium]
MPSFNWPIDGSIVGLYLLATMIAGLSVRRYVGRVDDFLVAGREMDVFLGIASLAATEFGIVTCMYAAQNGYLYGFAGATPGILMAISMLVVGVTGFCIKPLRDSGVITIPELIEQRFGPRVRWASGVVIVLGGLLNMGVFLRVGGEFLINVSGLNLRYLEIMMTVLLIGVAVYTILGGMLSVLVTDFLQFVVMSVGLIAVTIVILTDVPWHTIIETIESNYGAGGFNPFVNPELGWSYVIFNALLNFAVVLTWQTTIARVLAARDTQTGRKIYTRTSFFFVCRFLIPGLWGIAALAVIGHVDKTMDAMPTYLAATVPAGLMGLLIAAMLAADMSTDSSYMLTWGSVVYNDILAPFRRTKWSEQKGIFVNRLIVGLIGIFLLFYGLWYPLKGSLWSYLTQTGTIYLASMSVILIACCYWPRANSWGAAASIVVSAAIPIAYLSLEQNPSTTEWAAKTIGPNYFGIAAFVSSAIAMIVGSLLRPKLEPPSTEKLFDA